MISLTYVPSALGSILASFSSVLVLQSIALPQKNQLTLHNNWTKHDVISSLYRKRWPCLTDTLLLLPPTQLCPPDPCPDWVSVLPAVDWSTLIGGFARWFFGLAPPPPGAGVRSQQPVVPCAPPSPSLHTRAHAQGKTRTRNTLVCYSEEPTNHSVSWRS